MKNKDWSTYQERTFNYEAGSLIKEFYNVYGKNINNAIDLGCGAGNETKYLLNHGIKVTAIDRQINKNFFEDYIHSSNDNLKLIQSDFININLNNTDLLIAFFSIPFCDPDYFLTLWKKIYNSINQDGYFVGQLFGDRDAWSVRDDVNTFTKEYAKELLKDYKIIKFDEIEYVRKSDNKKWHFYNIIAQKK